MSPGKEEMCQHVSAQNLVVPVIGEIGETVLLSIRSEID